MNLFLALWRDNSYKKSSSPMLFRCFTLYKILPIRVIHLSLRKLSPKQSHVVPAGFTGKQLVEVFFLQCSLEPCSYLFCRQTAFENETFWSSTGSCSCWLEWSTAIWSISWQCSPGPCSCWSDRPAVCHRLGTPPGHADIFHTPGLHLDTKNNKKDYFYHYLDLFFVVKHLNCIR